MTNLRVILKMSLDSIDVTLWTQEYTAVFTLLHQLGMGKFYLQLLIVVNSQSIPVKFCNAGKFISLLFSMLFVFSPADSSLLILSL